MCVENTQATGVHPGGARSWTNGFQTSCSGPVTPSGSSRHRTFIPGQELAENRSDAILGAGKTATKKADKVRVLVRPIPRWRETDITRKLNKKGVKLR